MSISFLTTPPPYLGEGAALTAALIWSFTLCIYRFHAHDLPANTINLFKNVVAFLCLSGMILILNRPFPQEHHLWLLLMGSGVIGLVISDSCMFAALKRLGAQTTAAIQCLAPPLAAALALWAHDEVISTSKITGMLLTVLSVAGVILMARSPHGAEPQHRRQGLILALVAATAQAIGMVMAKGPLNEIDPATGLRKLDVFMGTLIRLAPAVIVLLLISWQRGRHAQWDKLIHPPRRLAYLGIASLLGSFIGLLLLTIGITYSSVGVATTLSATFPIWIIPVSYLFLGEKARPGQILCTVLAVVGVSLLIA